jgi:phosphatidylserine decarboxylase
MALVEPSTIAHRAPEIPRSVQPGGGFFVRLELAWGACRRAWLRRFRPGYVRRMLERRQGSCPDCPHDIIDPRDLKYSQNVCGFSFRPEDDRFAWRSRLGLARHGLVEIVCFSLLFALLTAALAWAGLFIHWAFWIGAVASAFFWFQAVYFFRDPKRTIPTDPQALLSPADGTVTHVETIEDSDFPAGRILRISIFLSVFNVHVNRVPRTGRVTAIRYFRGDFLDARAADCPVRNEQLWLDLEDEATGRPVRVKQIAGAIARRIVCWLKVGDSVSAGDRYGMIKFGSRTDVLLPATDHSEICVKVGDRVQGGSTVLLKLHPEASPALPSCL